MVIFAKKKYHISVHLSIPAKGFIFAQELTVATLIVVQETSLKNKDYICVQVATNALVN